MTGLGLSHLIPEILSIGMLACFLLKAILNCKKSPCSLLNGLVGGALLLGLALFLCSHRCGTSFGGMATSNLFGFYFKSFFTAVFLVIVFMCREFFKGNETKQQEFSLILWCSLIGLYFITSATHLLVLFISLEILTMSLYILAAYSRNISSASNEASMEGGLKYLILGSVASGFMIFGIALLYLQIGTLSFSGIAAAKQALWNSQIGILALLFIFAGLGFKISSFPFQLWVPDVYQGSPAPVSAFLSVASKAAGFLLLLRFFSFTVGPFDLSWKNAFAVLALITLLYGNLGALAQTSLKRLMGYSSIGHTGYLLMAFTSGTALSHAAILYYFLGYAASSLVVFYVITLIERETGSDAIENLSGLSQSSPFLASVLLVALFSLAGVPPLAGFMGKFWILFSTLQAGLSWLVLAGSAMIVVGIYYYLSIGLKMFFREPKRSEKIIPLLSSRLILIALTLLSLSLGFLQAPFLRISAAAIQALVS